MTQRIVLALSGIGAAFVIPMIVSSFGAPLFWSQAVGIVIGSLPIFLAVTTPERRMTITVPWLMAMSMATLVAYVGWRVWGWG